jgi:hypothetical protein
MSVSGPVEGGPVDVSLDMVDTDIQELWKVAVHLAKGPLGSPDLDNPDAVFAVLLIARELKLGPCAAMLALDLDDSGRVTLSGTAAVLLGVDGTSPDLLHAELCRLLLPASLGGSADG